MPVYIRQWLGTTHERLPAKLVRVDVDRYDLYIELEVDGLLDPLAKTGRQFRCGVGNVEKRE